MKALFRPQFKASAASAATAADLRRQTVETLRTTVGTRQQQVTNGPGDTAIAVIEGVQGDEPKMAKPGLEQRRFVRCRIQPVDETTGFCIQMSSWRRLEMDFLAANGARHHLHGIAGIIAPAADFDPGQAGVSARKQRGMPAQQTLLRHGHMAVGGGVEHHVDHALDVAIDRGECADVHTQSARDGRAHGLNIEPLALNLAGLDHVLGERREARLVTQGHAGVGQPPHQESLGTTDLGHAASQCRQVEAPVRPATELPDVFVIAAIHAQIMEYILRMPQLFTAPLDFRVVAAENVRLLTVITAIRACKRRSLCSALSTLPA